MMIVADTCKYICLLAMQLKLNNYRPQADYCTLCAHTDYDGSKQILCNDKNQSLQDCLLMAQSKHFYCVSKYEREDGGTLLGRDMKCMYGNELDANIRLTTLATALAKTQHCPKDDRPTDALNVTYCPCTACLEYEIGYHAPAQENKEEKTRLVNDQQLAVLADKVKDTPKLLKLICPTQQEIRYVMTDSCHRQIASQIILTLIVLTNTT